MNIGEAAARSGVSAKMIRYYESIGLIGTASRTASGYRTYAEADLHRLRFIRRARDLGFPMEKIETLLGLWGDTRRNSADVKALALRHIDELRQRIADMQAVLGTLEHLAEHCHGDGQPDCPIIDDLSQWTVTNSCHAAGQLAGAGKSPRRADKGHHIK
jgi:Cu(I)-responsive transcriptional regulator